MYRPSYTINDSQELAVQLIRDFPLGLLISNETGRIETNYLPFLVHLEGSELILITHMARSNPQWKILGAEVLVSFQGPNRYISPTMYHGEHNVPTWNYAAVQVQGKPELVTDKSGLRDLLSASVHFFEARNQTHWHYDLPASMQEKLEAAIVGVRIRATSVAKFKLSQNRNDQDYEAVIEYLKQSDRAYDHELLEWMRRSQAKI